MIYNMSELGSICGKNPFVPKELTLLVYWAKYDKTNCMKFLEENGVIERAEKAKNNLVFVNKSVDLELNKLEIDENTTNLNELVIKAVENYKLSEPRLTDTKIETFETIFRQKINQKLGSKSEKTVVDSQNARRPKKQVLWKVSPEITIKGICDCYTDNNTIIEVKTRTRLENVRKNEYDLYQLLGYMSGYNSALGKIVQRFQEQHWSSDNETENEYGLIDLNEQKWKDKLKVMVKEIKIFNNELYSLMTNGYSQWNLLSAFNENDLPICTINNKNRIINRNNKYIKLINLL